MLPGAKIGARQETTRAPKKKNKAVFVAGAGAVVALLLAAVTVKALFLKPREDAGEKPREKDERGKTPREAADDKRKELMREMGRKGAQKRWNKKREAEQNKLESAPEDVGGDDAPVSA